SKTRPGIYDRRSPWTRSLAIEPSSTPRHRTAHTFLRRSMGPRPAPLPGRTGSSQFVRVTRRWRIVYRMPYHRTMQPARLLPFAILLVACPEPGAEGYAGDSTDGGETTD